MNNRLCFVVMGYGKRMNPHLGIEVDLDQVYTSVIKPVLEESGYKVIRGDEITDCGSIDNSMYALLLKVDLVVADMSTLNPNAIYEVGVRHTMRPYHTILMMDKRDSFFFDLNHNRIIAYDRDGEVLTDENIQGLRKSLGNCVSTIENLEYKIDSPIFGTIQGLENNLYDNSLADKYLSKDLLENGAENSVKEIVQQAEEFRKNGKYDQALPLWEKLNQNYPRESYYIQQYALCTYKSETIGELSRYIKAREILCSLPESNDIESNSLKGAVCKRLYQLSATSENPDYDMLQKAIDYYGRVYRLTDNYYPGENYAYCLELLAIYNPKFSDEERQDFLEEVLVERKKLYRALRESAMAIVRDEIENPDYWMLATFCAICKSLKKEEYEESEDYLLHHASQQVIESYLCQNK